MRSALIGHTGFVGGSLARQASFEGLFNSKNIEEIAGQKFDLLVVSGMPAAKWIANGDPAEDRRIMDRLSGCVRRCQAGQVVVISTVDVYPHPVGVDEATVIDPASQQPYGRHRLLLEQELAAHFSRVLVVRLPGLFGPGLKKNAIYDLLHDNEVHKVNAAGSFQFYNMDRLWQDLQTVLAHGLTLINFATEPVTIREAAREAFDIDFDNDTGAPPARYDVRSQHAAFYGGRDGYLFNRQQVLADLTAFVAHERARRA